MNNILTKEKLGLTQKTKKRKQTKIKALIEENLLDIILETADRNLENIITNEDNNNTNITTYNPNEITQISTNDRPPPIRIRSIYEIERDKERRKQMATNPITRLKNVGENIKDTIESSNKLIATGIAGIAFLSNINGVLELTKNISKMQRGEFFPK